MTPVEPTVVEGSSLIVFAVDQPEYIPLPASVDSDGLVMTEWEHAPTRAAAGTGAAAATRDARGSVPGRSRIRRGLVRRRVPRRRVSARRVVGAPDCHFPLIFAYLAIIGRR